ncbi:MAG: hypothetical protein ACK4RS_00015 [Thiothrix sp.]
MTDLPKNIYIDIETAPTSRNDIVERLAEEIKPPGNIKKEESKAKWMEENRHAALWEKVKSTGLDGTLGELFCVGFAFDDERPAVIARTDIGFDAAAAPVANDDPEPGQQNQEIYTANEATLLKLFFDKLAERCKRKDGGYMEPVFVGHWITGFDLRFIWQRAVINQVLPTLELPINAKPWETKKVFDTKTQWTGLHSRNSSGSLDMLALVLGGQSKVGIDGSKVADALAMKRGSEVMAYCADDVERTRHIYKKITFQGAV